PGGPAAWSSRAWSTAWGRRCPALRRTACCSTSSSASRKAAVRRCLALLHGGCAGCVLKIQVEGVLRFDRCARHDRAMLQPILIVLHQETSTPGRIGHALRQRGYPLDVRRPRFGDPLPETMAGHAGAITFGRPMSANDTTDFLGREIDWLAVPLREKKPFLGICLGAQMLAHHLGSRVYRHPDGHAEVGYYPIRPTDIGRMVCDPWPEQVYQWHREGFDLPL